MNRHLCEHTILNDWYPRSSLTSWSQTFTACLISTSVYNLWNWLLWDILTPSLQRKTEHDPPAREMDPHAPPQLWGLVRINASFWHHFVSMFLAWQGQFGIELTKISQHSSAMTSIGFNKVHLHVRKWKKKRLDTPPHCRVCLWCRICMVRVHKHAGTLPVIKGPQAHDGHSGPAHGSGPAHCGPEDILLLGVCVYTLCRAEKSANAVLRKQAWERPCRGALHTVGCLTLCTVHRIKSTRSSDPRQPHLARAWLCRSGASVGLSTVIAGENICSIIQAWPSSFFF